MARILVTGGAGFIGSHLVEFLVKSNHNVVVIDNLSTGCKNNISHLYTYKNFKFVYGDICNKELLRKHFVDIDCICNLAAVPSVPRSIEDPLTSHETNINGFLNVLLIAKEFGIKRVVYASSSSVYGDDPNLPKKEHTIGNQMSPYAITKYVDELYANLFYKLYGIETIGMRFFNVFGPKQDPNSPYSSVISKFITNILSKNQIIINGNGEYSRDFTFVENVVSFINLSLFTSNTNSFGTVYNVGCGGRYTLNQLHKTIGEYLQIKIEPIYGDNRKGDIPHSCADISKAKNDLGYNVVKHFEDGIRETIDWYRKMSDNK